MKPQVCPETLLHRQPKLPPPGGGLGRGRWLKLINNPITFPHLPRLSRKTMETDLQIKIESITGLIHYIRGEKVILDFDLAAL